MKIVRYILAAINALLAILFLILAIRLCMIIGKIPSEATGTILTHEFIMADCARRALNNQRVMLFIATAFLGITAAYAFPKKRSGRSLLSNIICLFLTLSIMTRTIAAAPNTTRHNPVNTTMSSTSAQRSSTSTIP